MVHIRLLCVNENCLLAYLLTYMWRNHIASCSVIVFLKIEGFGSTWMYRIAFAAF